MKIRLAILYGVIFFLVLGLLGTGVARAEKTTLTLWVGSWICQDIPGEDQAYRLEKEFEAEYPNVDVKVVSVPWVGMLDKFMLAARTGDLPDLMCTESFLGWTQLFASYGHMMDLTDLMKETGENTFFSAVLEGQLYEGRYYSIPYRNSTRAFVYNKDMFEAAGLDPDKPPQTWAQVRENALKLTKDKNGDGVIDQWGFGYPTARFTTVAPEYVRAVMRSWGADILNKDMTQCTIDTPEAIEAIRFYTDLVTKDKVVTPDIINYSDDDDWQSFGNQAQAMAMVGPWAVETYDKSYPDVNYGVTTIPSNEEGVTGQFGLVHMGWMVSAHTKHKKEAFDLIKYTLRPEVDAWFTDSTPAVKSAWENPAFTSRYKPEVISTYKKQMENSISSILLIPPGPQIAREVNVAIQRIILGMEVEAVVKEAKTVIDDLLAE